MTKNPPARREDADGAADRKGEIVDPVLSHASALEYWKSVRIGSRHFRQVSRARRLIAVPPRAKEFSEPGPWWLGRPLHVLVADAATRRNSEGAVCHVWSAALPKGAVLDSENGFCVCAPELTFLQMAESMELVDLVELAFELCGTYDISTGEVRSCAPLTTVAKLKAYASKAEGARGRRKALRALQYVADGSASPRETVLTMLLCLPYNLGGYRFELPVLNRRIDVGARARNIASKQFYRCDLYWPGVKLALEYDSDLEHLGSRSSASDSSRRNALDALGVDVISVTTLQIASRVEMEKIAHHVARRLGKRLQYKEPTFSVANLRLRTALLGRFRYEGSFAIS